MSMILGLDDIIEAANKCQIPEAPALVAELEEVATRLAEALARHLKITTHGANWDCKDMGGLCASFYPVTPDQPCPDVIREGDEGGDWEPARHVWHNPNCEPSVIHLSPSEGREEMPCCNLSPFEVSGHDRMTTDPNLVTCPHYKKSNGNSSS